MTTQQFLETTAQTFVQTGIETPRLDSLVLLEDAIGQDRAHLLAHPEMELSERQMRELHTKVMRRAKHEPLAYIRGKALFYGRAFTVNKHVLVPRPETETAITLLKSLPLPPRPTIADIGTGSGCLGVTAGLEIQGSTIYLYDIDPEALAVAGRNAQTYHISAHCMVNDLLRGLHEQFDVLLANLPYVPDHLPVNQAVTFEPQKALFAGIDGLDHYRQFWPQIASLDAQPWFVITEAMPFQHHYNAELARDTGYTLIQQQDFIQVFAHTTQ